MLRELLEKYGPQNEYDSDYLALVVFALLEPGDTVPMCKNDKKATLSNVGTFKKMTVKNVHVDGHFYENRVNKYLSHWVNPYDFKVYKATFDVGGKRSIISFSCGILPPTMVLWSDLIGTMWQFSRVNLRYKEIFADIPEILSRVRLATAPFPG